jgi:WD40 repeat protein
MFCDYCGADNPTNAVTCFACHRGLEAEAATGGTPTSLLTELLAPGTLLKGRYRVLACIGRGGFGSVYRAQDVLFNNHVVALKEINLSRLKPQEIIEATDAFNREVTALKQLRHPNLPRLYHDFTDAEHWYMVMDFIEGETLERYLEQARHGSISPRGIQLSDVLHIGMQLCTVLHYMHMSTPPIIFRDLKPANIMIAPGKRIYLIDFGIARQYKPGKVRDTMAFGSPGYASPEQYGKAQTTPRSDIYSLGAILHHMLTGKDPSEEPFRFLPTRSYVPSLPIALDQLLVHMLDLDPYRRPASMLQVRQELERISNIHKYTGNYATGYRGVQPLAPPPPAYIGPGQPPPPLYTGPVQSRPVGGGQASHSGGGQVLQPPQQQAARQPAKKGMSRRKVFGTLALVGGGGGLILFNLFANNNGSSHPADSSYYSSQGATPSPAITFGSQTELHLHTAPVTALITLTSSHIMASASEDKTICLWDPTAPLVKRILTYKGHKQAVTCIAHSSDGGKQIASGSLDKVVQVWSTENGKKLREASFPAAVHALAWSSSYENLLAVGCADGVAYICDPQTLKTLYTYKGHTKSIRTLAWSPYNGYLASGGEDYLINLWRAGKGNPEPDLVYRGHANTVNALLWSSNSQKIASASDDRTIQIWDISTAHPLVTYTGHVTNGTPTASVDFKSNQPAQVYTLTWLKEENLIASAGSNGTIHIWDPATGTGVRILENESKKAIHSLTTFLDDSYLIAGGDADTILVAEVRG